MAGSEETQASARQPQATTHAEPRQFPKPRKRKALLTYVTALGFAAATVAILSISLTRGGTTAKLLLDFQEEGKGLFTYPWTIQNGMYLVLAVALAELWIRWRAATYEHALIDLHLLPEDDTTVLEISDPSLGEIRKRIATLFDENSGYLPSLIDISILRFFAGKSTEQTISVFNVTVEFIAHRVDLQYQLLRYLAWLIPTVGFIGTVVGIAVALHIDDPFKPDMKKVTDALGISFYTTIVALVESMIIMFFLHLVQKKEESAVNRAGNYCLKNLINRLYIAPQAEVSRTWDGFQSVTSRVTFGGH